MTIKYDSTWKSKSSTHFVTVGQGYFQQHRQFYFVLFPTESRLLSEDWIRSNFAEINHVETK